MPKTATRGKAARSSGVNFERRIARIFRGDEDYKGKYRILFSYAVRGKQYAMNHGLDESAACDVEGTPYWIECANWAYKGTTKALIKKKLKQAAHDTGRANDLRPTLAIVNNKSIRSEPILVGWYENPGIGEIPTIITLGEWLVQKWGD